MPRVSVGLPVFNGENFLEAAIRSVLEQSFADLELVVCDNASTDRTATIARDLAASDPRVRYHLNERNLGAAPNYNRTFALSTGELFKWLSHDDRLEPGYLAAVGGSARRPSRSGPRPQPRRLYRRRRRRVRALRQRPCRRRRSGPGAAVRGHDPALAFLRRLLRPGPAARHSWARSCMRASTVPTARSSPRWPCAGGWCRCRSRSCRCASMASRYTRRQGSDARARHLWHDSSGAGAAGSAVLDLVARLPAVGGDGAADRRSPARAAGRVLRRWWLVNWNAVRVGTDALGLLAPGAVGRAERLKARLFGAAPGHFAR